MMDFQVILSKIRLLREELRGPKNRLLTIGEAAHYCGISPKTIRNQIGRKAVKTFPVKPVKLVGRGLFRHEDSNNYIDWLAGGAE